MTPAKALKHFVASTCNLSFHVYFLNKNGSNTHRFVTLLSYLAVYNGKFSTAWSSFSCDAQVTCFIGFWYIVGSSSRSLCSDSCTQAKIAVLPMSADSPVWTSLATLGHVCEGWQELLFTRQIITRGPCVAPVGEAWSCFIAGQYILIKIMIKPQASLFFLKMVSVFL